MLYCSCLSPFAPPTVTLMRSTSHWAPVWARGATWPPRFWTRLWTRTTSRPTSWPTCTATAWSSGRCPDAASPEVGTSHGSLSPVCPGDWLSLVVQVWWRTTSCPTMRRCPRILPTKICWRLCVWKDCAPRCPTAGTATRCVCVCVCVFKSSLFCRKTVQQ